MFDQRHTDRASKAYIPAFRQAPENHSWRRGLEPFSKLWFNGRIVAFESAVTSVLTHGLNYGTGVFEGIRGYKTKDGRISVFRNKDHMTRFVESCRMLGLKMQYSVDEMTSAVLQVVKENHVASDLYIRPIAYVGFGGINLDLTRFGVDVAVGGFKFEDYFGGTAKGLKVCTSSWRKISRGSSLPLAKASGNYLNACLAKAEASRNGYDEAIFLDQDDNLCEGTGENLFVASGGKLLTPSLSSPILNGITRDTVIRFCESLGIQVLERDVTRGEAYRADEMFFTGTAAGVVPITEYDGRTIGGGIEGELTAKLRNMYESVVRGESEPYIEWVTFV
jgi:branched-chain amino acid aminotransferase